MRRAPARSARTTVSVETSAALKPPSRTAPALPAGAAAASWTGASRVPDGSALTCTGKRGTGASTTATTFGGGSLARFEPEQPAARSASTARTTRRRRTTPVSRSAADGWVKRRLRRQLTFAAVLRLAAAAATALVLVPSAAAWTRLSSGAVGNAVDPAVLRTSPGTDFVNVFQGLNGEQHANVFPHCCGYGESLAVSSTGQLGVAFWSNANPPLDGYVYESLDGSLGVSSTAALTTPAQTVPRGDRI